MPCIGGWILNHCTSWEVQGAIFKWLPAERQLSGKVYFRPIVAFHLSPAFLLVFFPICWSKMKNTPSSEAQTALVAFLSEHHAEAQASAAIWEEREEVSGTEAGLLIKVGECYF